VRRLRRAVTAGLLVSAGGVALPAAAQAKIVVVEKVLGRPSLKQKPDYKGEIEWNYPRQPLLGAVGFDKSGKLAGLWTGSKQRKTNKGIGPGASLAKVRTAYPKAKCSTGPFGPKSEICALKSRYHGRAVETLFTFFMRSMPMREVNIGFG
jgi:hypothetical protein